MKTIFAAALFALASSSALAQADNCSGYLKQVDEMRAAMKSAGQALPPADPSDVKIETYCKANPGASLADAMTKALD